MTAPTIMLLSLVVGALLATGHHLLYHSVNGQAVAAHDRSALGIHYTSQQLHTAAGTAFAFLVKASLVIGVSIAYTQSFWMGTETRPGTKPMRVAEVDASYALPNDPLAFRKGSLWIRQPRLIMLASIIW